MFSSLLSPGCKRREEGSARVGKTGLSYRGKSCLAYCKLARVSRKQRKVKPTIQPPSRRAYQALAEPLRNLDLPQGGGRRAVHTELLNAVDRAIHE
ncbi:hypothetical protein VUR80DRAFT_10372 [Thermomyces stellatus]